MKPTAQVISVALLAFTIGCASSDQPPAVAQEASIAHEQVRVIENELVTAKAELERLEQRFMKRHPRIQAQRQKVAELEKQLKPTQ